MNTVARRCAVAQALFDAEAHLRASMKRASSEFQRIGYGAGAEAVAREELAHQRGCAECQALAAELAVAA